MINISKYFKTLFSSKSETTYLNSTKANKERLEESIKQFDRGETTYKSLNLDSVGEMTRGEHYG